MFLVDQYAAAVLEKDWDAMGYASVEEWREAEFGMFRMLPEARREAAQLMLEGGQAVRGIAAATGAAERTIQDDLAAGDSPQSDDNTSRNVCAVSSQPATVSDTPQVSEPPKAPEPLKDVTHVTPPEPPKASPEPPKPATARKQRQRARQKAEKGRPDEPVSAGSTPNSSSSAEDGRPGGTAGHECVCPLCGHGHARKGEK